MECNSFVHICNLDLIDMLYYHYEKPITHIIVAQPQRIRVISGEKNCKDGVEEQENQGGWYLCSL